MVRRAPTRTWPAPSATRKRCGRSADQWAQPHRHRDPVPSSSSTKAARSAATARPAAQAVLARPGTLGGKVTGLGSLMSTLMLVRLSRPARRRTLAGAGPARLCRLAPCTHLPGDVEPIVCDIVRPDTLHALPEVETVLYAVGFDRQRRYHARRLRRWPGECA